RAYVQAASDAFAGRGGREERARARRQLLVRVDAIHRIAGDDKDLAELASFITSFEHIDARIEALAVAPPAAARAGLDDLVHGVIAELMDRVERRVPHEVVELNADPDHTIAVVKTTLVGAIVTPVAATLVLVGLGILIPRRVSGGLRRLQEGALR